MDRNRERECIGAYKKRGKRHNLVIANTDTEIDKETVT